MCVDVYVCLYVSYIMSPLAQNANRSECAFVCVSECVCMCVYFVYICMCVYLFHILSQSARNSNLCECAFVYVCVCVCECLRVCVCIALYIARAFQKTEGEKSRY